MSVGYRGVARILRHRILGGEFAPSGQLPSEILLAREFGCSLDTIRDAVMLLATEGLLFTRRGHLTEVRRKLTQIPVELPPNATVTTRPMTLDESDAIGCGRGVTMFEVYTPERGTEFYRGDLHVLITPAPAEPDDPDELASPSSQRPTDTADETCA
jgi:DNA-binding transcriptional MocR family regulator